MMTDQPSRQENPWRCGRCDRELETSVVTLKYMDNEFKTELPRCPQCGMVFISETLATGKMAEVEQLLEDK